MRKSAASTYSEWLVQTVRRYEGLAKDLVSHGAEKGRIVEGVVGTALQTVLPKRFSIGSGFAITATGKTSTQLDLVIYDMQYNSPLILEGGGRSLPD
jgi:hypothetical protein